MVAVVMVGDARDFIVRLLEICLLNIYVYSIALAWVELHAKMMYVIGTRENRQNMLHANYSDGDHIIWATADSISVHFVLVRSLHDLNKIDYNFEKL